MIDSDMVKVVLTICNERQRRAACICMYAIHPYLNRDSIINLSAFHCFPLLHRSSSCSYIVPRSRHLSESLDNDGVL
jgi:hypothetical protein